MTERAMPFHCPYCGDEDLRPHETDDAGHGAWECHSCLRAFTLKMLGMIARPRATGPAEVNR
jgi:transposase-like protein